MNSLTLTFTEGDSLAYKKQKAYSSSPTRAEVVEVSDSLDFDSSSGCLVLSKDFPFVDFIDKEFMTPAFKKQLSNINLVGSIQWVERYLIKTAAICC